MTVISGPYDINARSLAILMVAREHEERMPITSPEVILAQIVLD